MFKNRSFNVKMVKDAPSDYEYECTRAHYDAAEINTIITHQVKQGARIVVGLIAAKTISEIALHTARTYIK